MTIAVTAGSFRELGYRPYPVANSDIGPVFLHPDDRKYGTLLVGGQGSGKTSAMLRLALNDVLDPDAALIVFDPKSELSQLLLDLIPPDCGKEVWYLNLGHPAFGMSPLRLPALADFATEATGIGEGIVAALLDINEGQIFQSSKRYLYHASIGELAMARLEQRRPQFEGVYGLLMPKRDDMREAAANACHHFPDLDQTGEFFRRELPDDLQMAGSSVAQRLDAPRNKVSTLVGIPALRRFFNHPTDVPISRIIKGRGILLVDANMATIGEENAEACIAFIFRQLHQHLQHQVQWPEAERPRVALLADESHYLVSENVVDQIATHRAAGLDVTLGLQFFAQLGASAQSAAATEKIRSGVLNLVQSRLMFRLGRPEDAEEATQDRDGGLRDDDPCRLARAHARDAGADPQPSRLAFPGVMDRQRQPRLELHRKHLPVPQGHLTRVARIPPGAHGRARPTLPRGDGPHLPPPSRSSRDRHPGGGVGRPRAGIRGEAGQRPHTERQRSADRASGRLPPLPRRATRAGGGGRPARRSTRLHRDRRTGQRRHRANPHQRESATASHRRQTGGRSDRKRRIRTSAPTVRSSVDNFELLPLPDLDTSDVRLLVGNAPRGRTGTLNPDEDPGAGKEAPWLLREFALIDRYHHCEDLQSGEGPVPKLSDSDYSILKVLDRVGLVLRDSLGRAALGESAALRTVQYRLKRLYDGGLVSRANISVTDADRRLPQIYAITHRGLKAAQAHVPPVIHPERKYQEPEGRGVTVPHNHHALHWLLQLQDLLGPDIVTDYWRTDRYATGRLTPPQVGGGHGRHQLRLSDIAVPGGQMLTGLQSANAAEQNRQARGFREIRPDLAIELRVKHARRVRRPARAHARPARRARPLKAKPQHREVRSTTTPCSPHGGLPIGATPPSAPALSSCSSARPGSGPIRTPHSRTS